VYDSALSSIFAITGYERYWSIRKHVYSVWRQLHEAQKNLRICEKCGSSRKTAVDFAHFLFGKCEVRMSVRIPIN
jgi:hypothetical protein